MKTEEKKNAKSELPITERPWRLLNRDGTFNVSRNMQRRFSKRDLYHSLLSLPWGKLLLLLMLTYVIINSFFALLYVACGPGALSGIGTESFPRYFSDAFFFSVQTFSTIGYGKIVPVTMAANILVTLEALTGLLSVALATGLLFSRFSRPTARVKFSDFAVINSHEGVSSLIFRMANERESQIVEASVTVAISFNEVTREGETYRTFYDLKLERSRSAMFVFTWTIVHPIVKESPLFNLDYSKMIEQEAEIIVSLTGIDETFSQPIQARFSYTPDEILWEKKFGDMIARKDGLLTVDMTRFHTVEDSV